MEEDDSHSSGSRGSAVGATAQTLATNCIRLAAGMATGAITARALAPTGRGELAALTVWPSTLGYMITLGIPGAVVYRVRVRSIDAPEIIGTGLILALMLGCAAGIAGAMLMPGLLTHEPHSIVRLAQWLMPACLVSVAGLTVVGACQGLGDFARPNAMALAQAMLALVALAGLAALHRLSPASAAVITLSSSVPPLVAVARRLQKNPGLSLRSAKKTSLPLLNFGLRSYPLDLLGTFGAMVDQAVVTALLGPAALGLYVAALRGSRVLNLVQVSTQPVLLVKVTGATLPEVRAVVGRATRLITLMMSLAGLAVWVLAPNLIEILYGHKFIAAAPALRLLTVEAILTSAAWLLSQTFFALGRPGTLSLLQLPSVAALVILLALLTPPYGLLGAVWALVLTAISRLVTVMLAYPLYLRVPCPSLIPNTGDFKYLQSRIYGSGSAPEG